MNGELHRDGYWIVHLDVNEIRMAALVGLERRIQSLGGENRVPLKDDDAGWNKDLNGACGEAAYAKLRNVWWDASVGTFTTRPDVAGVQIRTRTRHDWDLFVRPIDKDTDRFIHVTGRPPTYRVHGWILGSDAKRPEWLQDHGGYGKPAYFVPAGALSRFKRAA